MIKAVLFCLLCIIFFQFVQLLGPIGFDGIQGSFDLFGLWGQLVLTAAAEEATAIPKELKELLVFKQAERRWWRLNLRVQKVIDKLEE